MIDGLGVFYGILTIVGYLKPDPAYTYTHIYLIFKRIVCR